MIPADAAAIPRQKLRLDMELFLNVAVNLLLF